MLPASGGHAPHLLHACALILQHSATEAQADPIIGTHLEERNTPVSHYNGGQRLSILQTNEKK